MEIRLRENERNLLWLGFAFAVAAFLFVRIHDAKVFFFSEGDDKLYFAHARKLAVDHNLHYANDPVLGSGDNMLQAARASFGPSLFWSPFVFVAHEIAPFVEGDTPEVRAGTSNLHYFAAALGSLLYGLLGLIFLYLFLQRFYSSATAFWAALLPFLSSPLLYYVFRRPLMSHSTEFFTIALALYLLVNLDRNASFGRILFSAFFTGMIFLTRWTAAFYVLCFGLFAVWKLRSVERPVWKLNLKQWVFGIVLTATVSLQPLFWKSLIGVYYPGTSLYDVGVMKKSIIFSVYPWTFVHMADIFIGKDWGLFWISPLVLLVFLGVLLVRNSKNLLWMIVVGLPAFSSLWIASNWPSHGGEYANRYMISLFVLIAFLFAGVVEKLNQIGKGKTAYLFLVAATLATFYSLCNLTLFKSGDAELTLHVAPTKYSLPSDWTNDSYAIHALNKMVHSPAFVPQTFAGSVAGYLGGNILMQLHAFPSKYAKNFEDYYRKHSPPSSIYLALFSSILLLGIGISFGLGRNLR